MKLSTKERQQGNSKNTLTYKNLQLRVERVTRKVEQLGEIIRSQTDQARKARNEIDQLKVENELLRMRFRLQEQNRQPTEHSHQVETFCNEPSICDHSFGARMIALCVNLAKQMSFRSVPKALKLIFEALGLLIKVPSHDAVEHWCKRIGLDQIKRFRQRYKDWLWIVDHSNQIGQEKVLVILGIRASKLPPPGQTLSLDQLEVLAIVPGKSWKRGDVREVYRQVAQRCGTPRFVVCDGAVELRETVDVLEKAGEKVVVLGDFKHFAANRFEKRVGKSERFKSFCSQMGKTRCQVQQTELAHLTPLSLKTKARFMNIGPVVYWARMTLHMLDNPDDDAVADVEASRLSEKLGWVKSYRDDIASWGRCCELIDGSLGWINTQGLDRDSGDQLEKYLDSSRAWDSDSPEGKLRQELIDFVGHSAAHLEEGERAWLSSEPIESAFGRYKCREFQHSRSGFTGLIVSLPTMLRNWTAEQVRESLARVKNKDLQQWTKDNIGQTVSGRRAQAYRSLRQEDKKLQLAT